ncbi:hypothetical protein IC620_13925 [Hazenella sp. IB182357]|uniref:Uncharacterized protein n=1 Tax=Polycladospora coralii TaxID=2771432 RepID=A0A926NBC7_9BACL|nr:hypothetical protein [Polycladospora coralii]MBD1373447.1 hypothetical protein [Polycladospora coralii]
MDHLLEDIRITDVQTKIMEDYQLSLQEWESSWFEWKRTVLMFSIIKPTSIISPLILDIWQTVLDQADDKQWLLERFPSFEQGNTKEQAWFGLFYLWLFQPTSYSKRIWEETLRKPLAKSWIQNFEQGAIEEIEERYFHFMERTAHIKVWRITDAFIHIIKKHLRRLHHHIKRYGSDPAKFYKHTRKKMRSSLMVILYESVYQYEQYPSPRLSRSVEQLTFVQRKKEE